MWHPKHRHGNNTRAGDGRRKEGNRTQNANMECKRKRGGKKRERAPGETVEVAALIPQ